MSDRIRYIVTDQGEVMPVVEERTSVNSFTMGRWMITWDSMRQKIIREVRSGVTLRVLYILPDHLDFEAWRRLDQIKLADELDTTQASISRALQELARLEIIERQGSGPNITWRLSLNYGWRGTPDQFHAARRRRQKTEDGARAPIAAVKVAEDIKGKSTPPISRSENIKQTRLRLLSPIKSSPAAPAA